MCLVSSNANDYAESAIEDRARALTGPWTSSCTSHVITYTIFNHKYINTIAERRNTLLNGRRLVS